MKILQLCLRVPYPPIDGGNIAMFNLAQSLTDAGCDVDILALNTKKHFIEPKDIPNVLLSKFNIQTIFVDTSITLTGAFKNLFNNSSYNIERFVSKDFENKLKSVLIETNYKVVVLESLFMTSYIDVIRKHSKAKIVMHAHNVEHVIWNRLQQAESNFIKKSYLKFLAARLETYEKMICKNLDAIIALTPDDEKQFRTFCGNVPVHAVPVGLDVSNYKSEKTIVTDNIVVKLFHLGSMDWMPNIEAVEWFLREVWPALNNSELTIELHLAGKEMPASVFGKATDKLKVYGRIENAKSFIADKDIMIVPLLAGSGMRVKIIEGMAAGKCIISTSIGAEGIQYTNRKNIFIADTTSEFIHIIKTLCADKNLIAETGRNAQLLAETLYDNKVLGKKVASILEEI